MSQPPSASGTGPVSAASAWRWIPTLYFGQGLPYVAVNMLSLAMYKNLGVSNEDIAFYTSWLNFPWVLKPLWAPLVDMLGRKRLWTVAMQFVIGTAFALVALTIPGPQYFQLTLAVFWLVAFSSATHDIAADGFYLLAMPQHLQAAFVGVRSTFYRLAMIAGQGGLVWLAGRLQDWTGEVARAWTIIFVLLAVVLLLAAVYHSFVLPRPEADQPTGQGKTLVAGFVETCVSFFAKPHLGIAIAFLLLYRLAEAQALRLVVPFLLDPRAAGGLGLNNQELGIAYGGIGVAALLLGGILGGYLISRRGLKRMLWPMILVMHVPIVTFVYLAAAQPEEFVVICAALAIEQFGYGFGFTAYMVFMMMFADGPHKTAHYAICTGFMALGIMLPGMFAGKLQAGIGYVNFFLWSSLCTLPSFLLIPFLRIDPAFGRKAPE